MRLLNVRKDHGKQWSNNIFVGDKGEPAQEAGSEHPPPIKLIPAKANPIDVKALGCRINRQAIIR